MFKVMVHQDPDLPPNHDQEYTPYKKIRLLAENFCFEWLYPLSYLIYTLTPQFIIEKKKEKTRIHSAHCQINTSTSMYHGKSKKKKHPH